MLCTVELTNQVVLSFIKESVSHDGTLYVPALQEELSFLFKYIQLVESSVMHSNIIVVNRLSVILRITVYK